jgi:membrane-bound metal-dependent hydrolase YbcI (DUF457 family)
MFFFSYLFIGIILGFLISDLLNDKRWIIPCIIGAVLPDIIDNAPGYLLLPTANLGGRFLFNNLIVFAVLLVAGFLLWKYTTSPIILALDVGIFSHQILDVTWTQPVYWLYPLLGPYSATPSSPPVYLFALLGSDLFNPSEWFLIIFCICVLILYWQQGSLIAVATRYKKIVELLLEFLVIVLWFLCGVVIACDLLKISLNYIGLVNPDQYTFTIVAIILGSILILRWKSELEKAHCLEKDPQVESIDQAARIDLKKLGVAIWNDPDRSPLIAAKEIALNLQLNDERIKRSNYLLILALFYTIIIASTIGAVILFISGIEIPEGMAALGAFAIGFFAGLLVMPEKMRTV